jgi:hypothetical protein
VKKLGKSVILHKRLMGSCISDWEPKILTKIPRAPESQKISYDRPSLGKLALEKDLIKKHKKGGGKKKERREKKNALELDTKKTLTFAKCSMEVSLLDTWFPCRTRFLLTTRQRINWNTHWI